MESLLLQESNRLQLTCYFEYSHVPTVQTALIYYPIL